MDVGAIPLLVAIETLRATSAAVGLRVLAAILKATPNGPESLAARAPTMCVRACRLAISTAEAK